MACSARRRLLSELAAAAQESGCAAAVERPAVEATALSTAVCTPPASKASAPQVSPGSASVAVTVVARMGDTGEV